LIEQACITDNPGFINRIVMGEIIWVLKRSYKLDKANICQGIEQIIVAINGSLNHAIVSMLNDPNFIKYIE
jgi:predicted nucleic-acid-binding protein